MTLFPFNEVAGIERRFRQLIHYRGDQHNDIASFASLVSVCIGIAGSRNQKHRKPDPAGVTPRGGGNVSGCRPRDGGDGGVEGVGGGPRPQVGQVLVDAVVDDLDLVGLDAVAPRADRFGQPAHRNDPVRAVHAHALDVVEPLVDVLARAIELGRVHMRDERLDSRLATTPAA